MHTRVLVIGMLAVLICGSGLGVMLYALQGASLTMTEIKAARPTAYPTAKPAPTPGEIGSTGHLMSGGDSILWVDEIGLWAWNRAYENRDDKGQTQVMRIYDTLRLSPGTAVRVTNRSRDAIQVEVIDGYGAGRRGWMNASYLRP